MVLFPLVAGLISLGCLAIAARRYWARRRPHELAWAIAFALFALAAFAEVVGDLAGWSPLLTRLYYVSGATLTVGFLGLGSLYLLLGHRLDRWGPGLMVGLATLGFAFVFTTPVDATQLDQGWRALQVKGTPTLLLTILVNSLGTLIVVGGALYSAVAGLRRGMPRERALGLVLIAAGTLLVASGGTLTRLGNHAYLYITMAPGVAIILLGYLRANRAGRVVVSQPVAARPGATSPLEPSVEAARPLETPRAEGTPVPPTGPVATVTAAPASPPSGLATRPLGPADVGAARALLRDSCVASPLAAEARYQHDAALAALLSDPGATWLGAERDGQLVALARLLPGASPATRHTARLECFAVQPAATGQGIGAALLREALAWADGYLGLARLELWLFPDQARVRRFYERHGFQVEGTARRALFLDGRHRDVLVLARVRPVAGES